MGSKLLSYVKTLYSSAPRLSSHNMVQHVRPYKTSCGYGMWITCIEGWTEWTHTHHRGSSIWRYYLRFNEFLRNWPHCAITTQIKMKPNVYHKKSNGNKITVIYIIMKKWWKILCGDEKRKERREWRIRLIFTYWKHNYMLVKVATNRQCIIIWNKSSITRRERLFNWVFHCISALHLYTSICSNESSHPIYQFCIALETIYWQFIIIIHYY